MNRASSLSFTFLIGIRAWHLQVRTSLNSHVHESFQIHDCLHNVFLEPTKSIGIYGMILYVATFVICLFLIPLSESHLSSARWSVSPKGSSRGTCSTSSTWSEHGRRVAGHSSSWNLAGPGLVATEGSKTFFQSLLFARYESCFSSDWEWQSQRCLVKWKEIYYWLLD